MAQDTLVTPPADNATTDADPAKEGGTLLTGDKTADSSSTENAPPQLPHEWMSGMTAEQKADTDLVQRLGKFKKGIPDLTQGYIELENKLSSTPAKPGEAATDEQKAAWREMLGVPKKPEDYALAEVELPEGLSVDEKMTGEFKTLAHEVGMSTEQVQAVHKWYMESFGAQMQEVQTIVKTTMTEATDAMRLRHSASPEEAQVLMERGFAKVGTPAIAAIYKTTGLGNHPDIVDQYITIGKLIGDSKFVDASRGVALEAGEVGNRTDQQLADALYPKTAGE